MSMRQVQRRRMRQLKPAKRSPFALGFESPAYRVIDIYVAQIYASALGGGSRAAVPRGPRERGLCLYDLCAEQEPMRYSNE